MDDWKIYQGNGETEIEGEGGEKRSKAEVVESLPAPRWRDFARIDEQRATTYKVPPDAVEVVNAALYLRRPILVTGQPGTGKTSLIYAVARELELGGVLTWPINSRSTLTEGLYAYDALARLRQAQIDRQADGKPGKKEAATGDEQIGRFIKLGPLGTAFLAGDRPRALLIDEIDKSDIDLPNDLLHVFEDGTFEIPELVRISGEQPRVEVGITIPKARGAEGEKPKDGGEDGPEPATTARIERGRVRCRKFPFVVITSNGERDLPPAFLRRCLRLDLDYPDAKRLGEIIEAHLPDEEIDALDELIARFRERQEAGASLATDQLLNTLFLVARGAGAGKAERETLEKILLKELEGR